ncbi:histidine phosphatase superfamily [Clohesyomyces aquaticus]|uniref:Histidine phosphatase superfamily n=1 Tax=Clohesyomyces aquaticus TaxID=1231657 RepID=A0A1Y1ZTK3_9PLEO|nr:histidine phosphatase superfamily [Clohesyomyces aquaticus]
MRLFLIRHGETVDNVAQVYAGSRDSELTNHGHQQATRLGQHFKTLGLEFTHIFSSHLRRAFKTASLIREAQIKAIASDGSVSAVPDVVQVPALMEQDFGFYEGKKWYEKPADSRSSGKDAHRQAHSSEPGFVDVESKESMAQRADRFIDEHLLPLFDLSAASSDKAVAIVSHGILLSVLWKRFLLRLPRKSVSLSPELLANGRFQSLEHLGAWSNTAYLELDLNNVATQEPSDDTPRFSVPIPGPQSSIADEDDTQDNVGREAVQQDAVNAAVVNGKDTVNDNSAPMRSVVQPLSTKLTEGWTMTVKTINSRDHVKGLKRTGGGVGSSAHDASQKSIESFFKRRKLG